MAKSITLFDYNKPFKDELRKKYEINYEIENMNAKVSQKNLIIWLIKYAFSKLSSNMINKSFKAATIILY